VPEVVQDGVSGVLVPADDRQSLESALRRLLQNPAERKAFGRAARERIANRFSLSAMAASYRELYRQDLAERRWLRPLKRVVQRVCPSAFVMWHGPTSRPEVAVTFDDGPDPFYTPRLLEILAAANARATFFLVGERVREYPEVVARIVADGHELANHSFSHPHLDQVSWDEATREIVSTRTALEPKAPGTRRLFRPPHGTVHVNSTLAPWRAGETVVLWNVDYKDYLAAERTDITARIARRPLSAGDIVLYHGHNAASVEALPDVLESARRSGLTFVPVSRMLES
jgi:peptidoglycan-N-acetylglucosamine deacetylase